MKKILLYGGSFDPVHLGHIGVCGEVSEMLDCEKVILLPAARSPLKKHGPIASEMHRLNMLRIATEGMDKFEISEFELNRPGPSYTYDTVSHFKNVEQEETIIYWLAGGDIVDELPYWHNIKELLGMCEFVLTHRSGFPMHDLDILSEKLGSSLVKKLKRNVIETAKFDVSSTLIRSKIASGEDVSQYLNPMVNQYIKDHGLYRVSSDDSLL